MISKIKSILGRRRFRRLVVISVLMIIGAIIDTCLTYIVLPFASVMTDIEEYKNNPYVIFLGNFWKFNSLSEVIAFLSIAIAAAYIIRNVYMLLLSKARYTFLADSKAHIASKLFGSITLKPYSYFTSTNTSAIQRICINDISRLFGVIDSMLQVLINFMTLIFITSVLLSSDAVLTILAFALMSFVVIFINRPISRKVSGLSKIYTVHYTSMLQWTQQFVGSLKTVLTERRQGYFFDKFSYHSHEFTKNEGRFSFLSNVSGYVSNALSMGIVFGYVAFAALQNKDLSSMIPTMALFAMAAMKLMPCVSGLAVHLNNIKYNESGVSDIYNQMNELSEPLQAIENNADCIVQEEKTEILKSGIKANHISFGFEDAKQNLFEDVSLEIPANKSVAFVGSTGAGKTTLADIILGLYKPQKGNVEVDGHDIFVERDWWAQRIGYIPQTIYLCEDTIRANVAFGVNEKDIVDEKVIECLRKAQILDFVEGLPDKMYTVTGENGIKLSGGQRQRMGIARALYHNPPFLVFDEATSALDTATEAAIMKTVNDLAEEKTILIIAHRLATIEKCDVVYKIEGGRVEKLT